VINGMTILAEVRDYETLLDAIRVRKAQLQLSNDALEQLAGLCEGHLSKLLPQSPTKKAGWFTLSLMLPALGSKLVLVEDPVAMERIRPRLKPRDECHVRRKIKESEMTPRYRVTKDCVVGSVLYMAGAEFRWDGWPVTPAGDDAIEAANEAGARILRYWRKHRQTPGCPSSPYATKHGRFYLPAQIQDPHVTRLPGVPEAATDEMPRYRAVRPIRLGKDTMEAGQEFAYTAWPPTDLAPSNDAAEAVTAYLRENVGNPNILPSPWCEFVQDVFLPELPVPDRQRPNAFGNVQPLTVGDDAFRELSARREAEARASLNARPRGSRRRVGA